MRLYSRTGTTTINDSEGTPYTADKNGAIEVPEDFGRYLHNLHIDGLRAWEDDAQRAARLVVEEHERRSDPAALYDEIVALRDQLTRPKRSKATP